MTRKILSIDKDRIRARILFAREHMTPATVAAMDSVNAHAQNLYVGFGADLEADRDKELLAAGITIADYCLIEALNRGIITDETHQILAALNAAVLEPLVRP